MRYSIILEEIEVAVTHKRVKNLHLTVHPPEGVVRISAPLRMSPDAVRRFAESKLVWIRKHRVRLRNVRPEQPPEYADGERHFYLGTPYQLHVTETRGRAKVVLGDDSIILHVRIGAARRERAALLERWYRERLKEIVPRYIAHWEPLMSVKAAEFGIKKMKTRWGTCNRRAARIWINLEMAKQLPELIEYIVVHELAHLLESNHGPRFKALMDALLPQWRGLRKQLNRGSAYREG